METGPASDDASDVFGRYRGAGVGCSTFGWIWALGHPFERDEYAQLAEAYDARAAPASDAKINTVPAAASDSDTIPIFK